MEVGGWVGPGFTRKFSYLSINAVHTLTTTQHMIYLSQGGAEKREYEQASLLLVKAFCYMTSHKLQQKLFHLFCTPEGILFVI